jgi:hypothetical protein
MRVVVVVVVGWVVACFPVGVRSETQRNAKDVGFRPSTQPTQFYTLG